MMLLKSRDHGLFVYSLRLDSKLIKVVYICGDYHDEQNMPMDNPFGVLLRDSG